MTSGTLAQPAVTAPPTATAPASAAAGPGRLHDLVQLSKPGVAGLSLATVAAGAWLAAPDATALAAWPAILGAAGVAVGGCIWNQVLERDTDARMRRTADRPVPAGRVGVAEAAVLGTLATVAGLALLWGTAGAVAAGVALATFVLYVAVYTPLKRVTALHVLVGAVAGALPPVIGVAAVTGGLPALAAALFAIVFLWQLPHVLALGVLYADDYRAAGTRVLAVTDPAGTAGARHGVGAALALCFVGVWPAVAGLTGPATAVAAAALGLGYLAFAVAFALRPDVVRARALFRVSLIHLPVLLLVLVLEPVFA